MWLEQNRQAMLQVHLSGKQFYCLQRCDLYQRFDGKFINDLIPSHGRQAINSPDNSMSTITRTYPKILLNLKGMRFLFKVIQSFSNLTDGLAPVLLKPVSFQNNLSIFPKYTQLSNSKKSVGNSLAAKWTTQHAQLKVWVACPIHGSH